MLMDEMDDCRQTIIYYICSDINFNQFSKMKKAVLTLAITLTSICAFAQQGEKAIGLNLSYGTEIENLGIVVKGQYGITDAIRAEASQTTQKI